MTSTTTTARTGTCEKRGAKLIHILTLQDIDGDEPPNIAPFSCPKCAHCGTLATQIGRRIVGVQTKLYRSPLGR